MFDGELAEEIFDSSWIVLTDTLAFAPSSSTARGCWVLGAFVA
jgi:hypothetical protein